MISQARSKDDKLKYLLSSTSKLLTTDQFVSGLLATPYFLTLDKSSQSPPLDDKIQPGDFQPLKCDPTH